MLALPDPEHGGSIDDLRDFVNVDDQGFTLMKAWLLRALSPSGPYPILALYGAKGNAKSTTTKILRLLIDPNTALLRSLPGSERNLSISAHNSWMLPFDNLSGVSPRMSDALCRLATGGGFATRELYVDCDEILFDATRPIILNGIAEVGTRADLLDRSIVLVLPLIPAVRRQTEDDLMQKFEAVRPQLLGCLLDAVSAAMRNLPSVKLPELPRMADFAKWATAGEEALSIPAGGFMSAYRANLNEGNQIAIDTNPVATAVLELMARRKIWEGTATYLLKLLTPDWPERPPKGFPDTPSGLSAELKRVEPNLRQCGIEVSRDRKAKQRWIKITKVADQPNDGDDGNDGKTGSSSVPEKENSKKE